MRIFIKDKRTGLPKEDILNVNLQVIIKEADRIGSIDISKYNLEKPENGLFIAFEKLFILFNVYNLKKRESAHKGYYAPIISFSKHKK